MAKEIKMLICQATKEKFPYRGYGRPPLYCPAEAKRRQAQQRKNAQEKLKKAKKAAKALKKAA